MKRTERNKGMAFLLVVILSISVFSVDSYADCKAVVENGGCVSCVCQQCHGPKLFLPDDNSMNVSDGKSCVAFHEILSYQNIITKVIERPPAAV